LLLKELSVAVVEIIVTVFDVLGFGSISTKYDCVNERIIFGGLSLVVAFSSDSDVPVPVNLSRGR
jgi:hypothetical protein